MAKEGEKRISRVAVGSERKKNLTRPMRSKHPETPKRLTKSIILSLSIGGVDPRYRRTILSTCLYVDSVALFPFLRQHTQKLCQILDHLRSSKIFVWRRFISIVRLSMRGSPIRYLQVLRFLAPVNILTRSGGGGRGRSSYLEKLGRKQLLVPKTLPGKPVFFLNRWKFSPILANSHISGR